jgi:hypothetical protein
MSIFRPVAILLVGALGLWLAYHVVRAIRTGIAQVHLDLVHRTRKPAYYWTIVVVQAALATIILLTLARVLSR